jgi:PQQ-like domain
MPGSVRGPFVRAMAAVAVLSLAASGCWLQRGFGPGRDRSVGVAGPITPANADQLVELWRTTGLGGRVSEPVAINDDVFVTAGATVSRLSASTGAVQYSRTLADPIGGIGFALSGPIYHHGELLAGWTTFLQRSPVEFDSAGGRARLVPATGELIEPLVPAPDNVATEDMAEEAGQLVPQDTARFVVGLGTSRYFPQVTWRGIHATLGEQQGDFVSPAPFAIAGDHLVWANVGIAYGWDGTTCSHPVLGATDGTTCLPDWQTLLGFTSSGLAALGADAAVYSVDANQITVLDAATGAVRFTGTVPGSAGGPLSPPAVAGDTIVVTTADGRVAAFAAGGCGQATCAPRWVATIGTTRGPAPTVAGQVVYAATTDAIVTLDLAGCGGAAVCPPIATYGVGDTITGVAYDEGRLLVTTANGQVSAFGLPPT